MKKEPTLSKKEIVEHIQNTDECLFGLIDVMDKYFPMMEEDLQYLRREWLRSHNGIRKDYNGVKDD